MSASSMFSIAVVMTMAGCGGESFCDRYEASTRWHHVDRTGYRAAAFDGFIRVTRNGGVKSLVDDRTTIAFDAQSYAGVLTIVVREVVSDESLATLTVPLPETAGAHALRDASELVVGCTPAVASRCRTRVPVEGTILVRARPPVEVDEIGDMAFSVRIDAQGSTDAIGVTIELDVVAFASIHSSCSES